MVCMPVEKMAAKMVGKLEVLSVVQLAESLAAWTVGKMAGTMDVV